MRRPAHRAFAALCATAALLFCSCGAGVTSRTGTAFSISPPSVDFGPVGTGFSQSRIVRIENNSRIALSFAFDSLPDVVSLQAASSVLPAGATADVRLVYSPRVPGSLDVVVQLVGADAPVPLRLSGSAEPLALAVSPSSLDFGVVELGSSADRMVTFSNRAAVPLEVELSTGDGSPTFRPAATGLHLEPRASTSLPVRFEPLDELPAEQQLRVSPCPSCAPTSVALSGRGGRVELDASPRQLDFGAVTPGSSLTLALRVTNLGAAAATVASVEFSDGDASCFHAQLPTGLPASLGSGGSLSVYVTFTAPPGRSAHAALLLLGPGARRLLAVPLSGMGGGPRLVASPPSLDFGLQATGSASRRSLTVSNVGDLVDVQILSVTLEDDSTRAFSYATAPLPANVTTSPLTVVVDLHPQNAGELLATLVLRTSDAAAPTLRVPLRALARAFPPCTLVADPGALRFGQIPTGVSRTRPLDLVNAGRAPCYVWDVALTGSPKFTLNPLPSGPIEIAPSDALTLRVTFYAPAFEGTIDAALLEYSFSGPGLQGVVALSAAEVETASVAAPALIDFGSQELGSWSYHQQLVTNRSGAAVALKGAQLAFGSSTAFGASIAQPAFLPTDAGLQFRVDILPRSLGRHRGALELLFDGRTEPVVVELAGSAIPCSGDCTSPTVTCPAPQTVRVNSDATFPPTTQELTNCSWTVRSRPPGSRASASTTSPSGTRCLGTLRPDVAGHYELELTASNAQGRASRCTAALVATAPPGLWVEAYWNLPTDVDLHLLNASAGDPTMAQSWATSPYDCSSRNPTPSWDSPASSPSLERDDAWGAGPELIRIDAPAEGTYYVGVHWLSNWSNRAAVHVTVSVFEDGRTLWTGATPLARQGDLAVLGAVHVDSAGPMIWVPISVPVLQL